jgi:hypothetical protein
MAFGRAEHERDDDQRIGHPLSRLGDPSPIVMEAIVWVAVHGDRRAS